MKIKTTLTMLSTIIGLAIIANSAFSQENGLTVATPVAAADFSTKFSFVSLASVNVANTEELYAAVNNSQNAGNQIVIAPGVYSLSVNDPNGAARPNGGRIELQENMSLRGVFGNREAVVIDAFNLPASSYTAPPVTNVGAIRLGRGTNSVEWLTIRNAVNGAAGIETTIVSTGTTYVRVAHVVAAGNVRGVDVRSFGTAAAGRVIEAEIVDNDMYNNRIIVGIGGGAGLRITNNTRADGGIINAALSGNRSYNNNYGLIIENVNTLNGTITVSSAGNRFFENGLGTHLGGGLNQTIPAGSFPANGNTVNFTANGDSFENNNGFNPNDRGGLFIIISANFSIPNGTSNNTVNATLRNCRFANNQQFDIGAVGARSSPASIGTAGTNNRAKIRLYGALSPNISTTDSIPDSPDAMNSVAVVRNSAVPSFDYDGDGRADLSVFRPSDTIWYLNRNQGGFDAVQFGLASDRLAPADYDGDGKTDIAVYRAGVWFLRRSQLGFLAIPFGTSEDIPPPADYDGDGRTDAALYRNGAWYLRQSANEFSAQQFGLSNDKPVPTAYLP